jgi:hypothetical protein
MDYLDIVIDIDIDMVKSKLNYYGQSWVTLDT